MKIIGICGSPRKGGNTEIMVKEALCGAKDAGADTELIHLGKIEIKFCDGCLSCDKTGKCHIEDGMNEINEKLTKVDGFIIATPSYMNLPNGRLKNFMDRICPILTQLKRKKAIILGVGSVNEEWIMLAIEAVNTFCKYREIEVVGFTLGVAEHVGEIKKDKKVLKKCAELGKNLVESIKE